MAFYGTMLAEAVRNSTGRSSYVEGYDFGTDNLQECATIFDYNVVNETNNIAEMIAVTDEIMAEAAMNNPDAMDTISESVFGKIKDGVRKFFDKVISMVKGIIDKLKAFLYRMTGKTQKWLSVMKPKIQDVINKQSGYQDVSYEMFEYDEKYVTGGMLDGFSKLVGDFTSDTLVGDERGVNSVIVKLSNMQRSNNRTAKGSDASADQVSAAESTDPALKECETLTKKINEDLTKFKSNFWKTVASKLGAGSAATADAVWADCTKKAHKNGSEKKEVKFGANASSMLTAVENCVDTITKLKESYDKHLEDLKTKKENYEKEDFMKVDDATNIPQNVSGAIRSTVSAYSSNMTEKISLYEQALNGARNKNTALVQEMAGAYMSALTKLASYKASKK